MLLKDTHLRIPMGALLTQAEIFATEIHQQSPVPAGSTSVKFTCRPGKLGRHALGGPQRGVLTSMTATADLISLGTIGIQSVNEFNFRRFRRGVRTDRIEL